MIVGGDGDRKTGLALGHLAFVLRSLGAHHVGERVNRGLIQVVNMTYFSRISQIDGVVSLREGALLLALLCIPISSGLRSVRQQSILTTAIKRSVVHNGRRRSLTLQGFLVEPSLSWNTCLQELIKLPRRVDHQLGPVGDPATIFNWLEDITALLMLVPAASGLQSGE